MDGSHRSRRKLIVATATAVFVVAALAPGTASAQSVEGLLDSLLHGTPPSSPGAPDLRAGSPPNYTPPLHGSNPHGQGTVGVVDLTPSNTLPLPADPENGDEEVTIGDSRGEDNGTYHGRVTLLHVNIAGLINESVIEAETNEGQTNTGPLGPLNAALNTICQGAPPMGLGQGANCIQALPINSSTTSTGSQNSFGIANTNLNLGVGPLGALALALGVGNTSGNISEDGTCQTATGSSSVASASVGAPVIPPNPISVGALQGTSSSQACNNGTQSQSNSSTVANLNGTGIPVPATGCDNGTPNTNFVALAPLLSAVCNANTSNGSQAGAPYGVREALTVFVLNVLPGGDPVLKVTTAGPESRATAPPAVPGGPLTPDGGTPGGPGDGGPGGPGDGDGDDGPGDGPVAGDARDGLDTLAFTGASLMLLGVIGAGLIVGGLAVAAAPRRNRRATT
jgi:hypothetical protein